MFYALAAPAAQYAADRQTLLAVLKSFRSSASASTPAANLSMEPFREPTEGAYQSVKPSGWQVAGGVRRISNNDVRVGIQLLSPDRAAAIWLGDVRLNRCVVLGANMRQFRSAPLGAGAEYCPYRDGIQTAEVYALRALSADHRLEGLRITGRGPRPDLGQMGMTQSYGEVRFSASRQGNPVEGVVIGSTIFSSSGTVDPNGGIFTSYVTGFLAPATSAATIASAASRTTMFVSASNSLAPIAPRLFGSATSASISVSSSGPTCANSDPPPSALDPNIAPIAMASRPPNSTPSEPSPTTAVSKVSSRPELRARFRNWSTRVCRAIAKTQGKTGSGGRYECRALCSRIQHSCAKSSARSYSPKLLAVNASAAVRSAA